MGVIAFTKPESPARIIQNAMEIALESRRLSHGDGSYEMVSWMKTRAIAVLSEHPNATASYIACQLLTELRDSRPVRGRRSTQEASATREPNGSFRTP